MAWPSIPFLQCEAHKYSEIGRRKYTEKILEYRQQYKKPAHTE
jgi:hypothetical protein